MGQALQLFQHLLEIAFHEGLDLRPVDGDVAAELDVRPDDGVHLALGAAGPGLHHVHVAGRVVGGRAHDEGGRAVAEDHARRADAAHLVGELLGADQQDRALHLLQDADRVRQAVGEAGAGGDEVDRGVGLEHAELSGEPRGGRRQEPGVGAGAEDDGAHLLGRAPGAGQRARRRVEGQVLEAPLGVAAALDARLGRDLRRAHRRPVGRRVADDVVVGAQDFAAPDGEGLDTGLHREPRPHLHRGQGGDRGPRRRGGGDAGPARLAVLHAPDEVEHVAVAGLVDDHDVVALQRAHRGQPGVRAVPRILVVQGHGPAPQRLQLGHALVAVEDLAQAEPGVVGLVRPQPVHELRAGGDRLGDRRLDGRQVGRVVPLVAEHVEQHAEQLVLDLGRPRRGQPAVAGVHRRDLAFSVLPGRQGRQEDVVAAPGHVAPAGRPLLVHRDHVAVHPEQVQPQIAQQLVAVGVAARFRPLRYLRAGRRLDLEVAPHDGREVLDGVDGREVRFGEEVGREDEPAVRVHDKGFHFRVISGARPGESAAAPRVLPARVGGPALLVEQTSCHAKAHPDPLRKNGAERPGRARRPHTPVRAWRPESTFLQAAPMEGCRRRTRRRRRGCVSSRWRTVRLRSGCTRRRRPAPARRGCWPRCR